MQMLFFYLLFKTREMCALSKDFFKGKVITTAYESREDVCCHIHRS